MPAGKLRHLAWPEFRMRLDWCWGSVDSLLSLCWSPVLISVGWLAYAVIFLCSWGLDIENQSAHGYISHLGWDATLLRWYRGNIRQGIGGLYSITSLSCSEQQSEIWEKMVVRRSIHSLDGAIAIENWIPLWIMYQSKRGQHLCPPSHTE